MRRNAPYLAVLLSMPLVLCSCSLFKKKSGPQLSDVGPADPSPVLAPAGSSALTSEYAADPYPTYGETAPVEPAAEPVVQPSSRAPAPPAAATYHTVVRKDTLFSLARMYYSDASRWKDIYKANRSIISDPNKIRVGDRLLIP